MLNFDNFFRNHFDSTKISDDELNRYSVEHIKLLAAVPRFSGLVTVTITAHEGYFGAITDEATSLTIQKSLTKAMTGCMKEFKTLISRHEGAIRSKWGEDTPNYLRFFPRGITEYRRAILENIDEKMTRFQKAMAELGGPLDPDVVKDFMGAGGNDTLAGVIPRFQSARDAQLAAKGDTTASKSSAHTNRDVLEIQLMKNLLTVALDAAPRTKTERNQLRRLLPQHLLEDRQRRTDDPPDDSPAPAAGP